MVLFVASLNFGDETFEFGFVGAIDIVVIINTDNRAVGRNHDDLHVVDLFEFLFFGLGRTGHARELFI